MEKIISPLLHGISDKEWQEMQTVHCMRQTSYMKNAIIFHSGTVVSEIGIVISGNVHIESNDFQGSRSILSNVSVGQIFAETYALCREPMMVDVTAADNCEILFLNLNILTSDRYSKCSWQKKFMRNILHASVQKNLVLSNRIFCTTPKSARARIMTYLSHQSVREGSTTFQSPFNRQQMADYLNLDRSALSKELGRMRDEGILEFHKNQFTLKHINSQASPSAGPDL